VHLSPETAEGAIYPDYGAIVEAPRIVIVDKGVSGDLMIVTLLSSDQALLESFSYDGSARLAGSSCARRYEFSIEFMPEPPHASEGEGVGARVTVAVEQGGKTLSFLRNAGETDGWNGVQELFRGDGE